MGKYERVMKRCEKFYNHPKKEEVYDLSSTMIEFLIPRLELFLNESTKIIDWEFHKKEQGIYMERDIRSIIKKLKYIEEHLYDGDDKSGKRCDKYIHEVFDKLGDLYFYLWY